MFVEKVIEKLSRSRFLSSKLRIHMLRNLSFLKIGKRVFIGEEVILDSIGNIEIGNDTFITARVVILTHSLSTINLSKERNHHWDFAENDVEIGDRVFIGTGSVLIGPVSICNDCVIAAHSVVTKDIVTPGIYAGSPARKISDLWY